MLMLADGGVSGEQVFETTTAADLDAHPVRQELVDEVKRKTKKWVPREVKHNHFRNKTAREIRDGTLGSLDEAIPKMSPASKDPFDFLGEKYVKSQQGLFGTFQSLYQTTLGSISSTLQSGLKKSESDYENLPFKIDGLDDAARDHARVAESKRPKKPMITGDGRLPRHYFYRDKYPMCKP